jgi:hypothetical protein
MAGPRAVTDRVFEGMLARFRERLMDLWQAAGARIDRIIIGWAVGNANESEEHGFGTRRFGERNASHARNSPQPRRDKHEP